MNVEIETRIIDQARYLTAFLGQQFAPSETYRCAISPIVQVRSEVDGEPAVEQVQDAITANFSVSPEDLLHFQEIVEKLHAYTLTGNSLTVLIDAEIAKMTEEA